MRSQRKKKMGFPKIVSRPTSVHGHHVTLNLAPQFLICTGKRVRAGRWLFTGSIHQNSLESCFQMTQAPEPVLLATTSESPQKKFGQTPQSLQVDSRAMWQNHWSPTDKGDTKWNSSSSQTPACTNTSINFSKRCAFSPSNIHLAQQFSKCGPPMLRRSQHPFRDCDVKTIFINWIFHWSTLQLTFY